MTLAEFLTARLDEDEHWAHMAEAGWPPVKGLAAARDPEHYPFMATDITPSKATFIEAHPPARVLREVEAKRKILAEYEYLLAERKSHPDDLAQAGALLAFHGVIRNLAAVYADHEDFDPDWSR